MYKYEVSIRNCELEFLKLMPPAYQALSLYYFNLIAKKGLTAASPFRLDLHDKKHFFLHLTPSYERSHNNEALWIMGEYDPSREFDGVFKISRISLHGAARRFEPKHFDKRAFKDAYLFTKLDLSLSCPLLENSDVLKAYKSAKNVPGRKHVELSFIERIKNQFFTSIDDLHQYSSLQKSMHWESYTNPNPNITEFDFTTNYKIKRNAISINQHLQSFEKDPNSIVIVNFISRLKMSEVAQISFTRSLATQAHFFASDINIHIVNVVVENMQGVTPYMSEFMEFYACNKLDYRGSSSESRPRPFSMVLGRPIDGTRNRRLYDFDLLNGCFKNGMTSSEQDLCFQKNIDSAIHEIFGIIGQRTDNAFVASFPFQKATRNMESDLYDSVAENNIVVIVNNSNLIDTALSACTRAIWAGYPAVVLAETDNTANEITVIGERKITLNAEHSAKTEQAILNCIIDAYETKFLSNLTINEKKFRPHFLTLSNVIDFSKHHLTSDRFYH